MSSNRCQDLKCLHVAMTTLTIVMIMLNLCPLFDFLLTARIITITNDQILRVVVTNLAFLGFFPC